MGPRLCDYWPFVPSWLPLHSYGMFVALGFLSAALIARRRAKTCGLPPDSMIDLALWAIVAGVAGGRLFYVIEFYKTQFSHAPLWYVFALNKGGLVFYGGFITGTLACAWYVYRHKLPVLRTLDVVASVVMLGLAFGRLGCFSAGCCWGRPTQAWCGIVFPKGAPAYHDTGISYLTPLIPSQLISSFNAFVLFLILSAVYHWFRRKEGLVAALLLILYPINRFWLETLRGDTAQPGALSIAQKISIPACIAGVVLLIWVLRRPARPDPPPAAESQPAPAPPTAQPPPAKGKGRHRRR